MISIGSDGSHTKKVAAAGAAQIRTWHRVPASLTSYVMLAIVVPAAKFPCLWSHLEPC